MVRLCEASIASMGILIASRLVATLLVKSILMESILEVSRLVVSILIMSIPMVGRVVARLLKMHRELGAGFVFA